MAQDKRQPKTAKLHHFGATSQILSKTSISDDDTEDMDLYDL